MSITESWRAGREAVAEFSRFCAQQGWVFVEVPEQSDFGKDGYVDLTTPEGEIPGNCFAVQIKGGFSRWRDGGYRIDATERQRKRWAISTVPVIGIAFDPDTGWLHWCDLSKTLNDAGLDADLIAPRTQHLNGEPELKRFQKYLGAATLSQSSILDLVSPSSARQVEAVFSCYVVGREDGRALVLLRKLLFSLSREAREFAIWQLSHAIWHPDVFHTHDSMVSKQARAEFERSLVWTVDEARILLSHIDEESGLDRGSIGQTIALLLLNDPDANELLAATAAQAATQGDDSTASWALTICVHLAGDKGRERLNDLLDRTPLLAQTWAAPQIAAILDEVGWISID